MSGYIYLYGDTGYPEAVKIGYDASAGCRSSWKAVPSFSPRPMAFHAAWEIPGRLMAGHVTAGAARRAVEARIHSLCGPMVATQPGYSRAGRDWCLIKANAAEQVISQYLGATPVLRDAHRNRVITNDNFRNPHPSKVAGHRFKIALWVYREMHTGLLKTQFVDDWTSPHEWQRRYSRNGIEECAAFSYAGATTAAGNLAVLEAWKEAVEAFGFGCGDLHYGWLREDAVLDDLLTFYGLRLLRLQIGKASPVPEGIRRYYNQAA